jgi:hypothetical protein
MARLAGGDHSMALATAGAPLRVAVGWRMPAQVEGNRGQAPLLGTDLIDVPRIERGIGGVKLPRIDGHPNAWG